MRDHSSRINYLMDTVDGIENMTAGNREIMLILLYWKVFDGIDIPDKLMREIRSKGSKPGTIGRLYRKAELERRTNKEENEVL